MGGGGFDKACFFIKAKQMVFAFKCDLGVGICLHNGLQGVPEQMQSLSFSLKLGIYGQIRKQRQVVFWGCFIKGKTRQLITADEGKKQALVFGCFILYLCYGHTLWGFKGGFVQRGKRLRTGLLPAAFDDSFYDLFL